MPHPALISHDIELRPVTRQDLEFMNTWRFQALMTPCPAFPWPPGDNRLEELLHPIDAVKNLCVHLRVGPRGLGGLITLFGLDWKNRSLQAAFAFHPRMLSAPDAPVQSLAGLARFAARELNIERLELDVLSDDEQAARYLLAAGFVREAVKRDATIIDGRFRDVSLWASLREPS